MDFPSEMDWHNKTRNIHPQRTLYVVLGRNKSFRPGAFLFKWRDSHRWARHPRSIKMSVFRNLHRDLATSVKWWLYIIWMTVWHTLTSVFSFSQKFEGVMWTRKKLSHRVKKPLTSPLPLQKRYPYIYPIYYLKFLHSHPPPTFLFVEQRKMMVFSLYICTLCVCVCKGRGREMMMTTSSSSSSSGRFCRPPPLAEEKKVWSILFPTFTSVTRNMYRDYITLLQCIHTLYMVS